jgi:ribosome biogenesis GTPase
MNLSDLGWNDFFSSHFAEYKDDNVIPARVISEHRERYIILCEKGEFDGRITGKLRYNADLRSDFPAVGDWVTAAIRNNEKLAAIHTIIPRKSCFSRKAVLAGGFKGGPGKTDEQVLAANIDTLFIVAGLDGEHNIRRIERYVTAAWDSGASPVIILNKTDLCNSVEDLTRKTSETIFGVDIHPISAVNGLGFNAFENYLKPGKTAAFLGSSGVGKSTIINRLLGSEQLKTSAVREYDKRGRHTTTHRELIILPSGGIVIDTPGMREFQAWDNKSGLETTFSDIEELITRCKFTDCAHQSEPGCAIKKALEDGTLDSARYDSYLKLQRELKILQVRKDHRARKIADEKWKQITINHRKRKKFHKKNRLK